MNLSFAGCGFLGIYHVGVAVCFKKYAPHLLLDKISGASAGAIAACCLLCDLPLGTITSNVLKLSKEARKKTLGPFSPSFNVQTILLESLQKYLPNDAHIRVSGKLHVSLTRVYDGKNVIVSQFHSREDLLQALLASSFIPLFSGLLPPRFHGIRYMDGGFSDNLPTLDENTITISPFCGESDICPRDVSSQLFHVNFANTSIELSRQNIYRFARILFPPNAEILSNMCKQGFDDALRFLQRNNLINCTRCLAVQSTFLVSETLDDNKEYDPECSECKIHRQEALVANLPETVMTIFQDAIDSANKGLVNWLFRHKSMKLLSFLSLPYTLPIDVICATLNKLLSNGPKFNNNLIEIAKYLTDQLYLLISRINGYNIGIWQCLDYELSITQYHPAETNDNVMSNHPKMSSFIINMNEFGCTDDTFENALQSTSNQEALEAYYYMNNTRKKNQDEDVPNVPKDKSIDKYLVMEGPKSVQGYFWDKPFFIQNDMSQVMKIHKDDISLKDVEENEDGEKNLDKLSDTSVEESNIFSDPESEWTTSVITPPLPSSSDIFLETDLRPEVDQPLP